MALAIRRCNIEHIARWIASWATLEATGCHHWATICTVLPRRPPGSSVLDWFLSCVVHKQPKPVEPGTGVADTKFHCRDSDNSEYRFVFSILPKYYWRSNIPLTTHNHHPQHHKTMDTVGPQEALSSLSMDRPAAPTSHGAWRHGALAGNVGGMSATCRDDSWMLALLADISLWWRHKTNPNTVFLCQGLPTFAPFHFSFRRVNNNY